MECALNADKVTVGTSFVNETSVVTILYRNSNNDTNGGIGGLNVPMYCDEEAYEPLYGDLSKLDNDGAGVWQTTMISQIGCPIFSFNAINQFLAKYKYLWGIIFIIIGSFLSFFGHQ